MYLEATNANQAGGGLPVLTGPGFVTPNNAAAVKELGRRHPLIHISDDRLDHG